MFVLKDYQLPQVAGGDHWGYEDSSGSADENSSSANSYQNSSGTWGNPGSSVSVAQNAALGGLGMIGPQPVSAACVGTTVATTGAVGSALRSPTWDNITKAVGGLWVIGSTSCGDQLISNQNNVGYGRVMFGR